MDKKLNIGSLNLNIPDYSSDVGQAIEQIQNAYEAGEVQTLFAVMVTKTGVVSAVVGDRFVMPMACVVADALTHHIMNDIQDAFIPHDDEED